ncbi:MAG: DUF3800 domain-containing protein [Patescibacteria group bacterium]
MLYFVDESGDLDVGKGSSKYFLICCVSVNNPRDLSRKISKLEYEIEHSAILSRHWKDFRKHGFHASENHPDIYLRFINLLNTIDFRAYFIFIEKGSQFEEMVPRVGKELFYDEFIKIILIDRIIKDEGYIVLNFEQNLPNQKKQSIRERQKELREVISETIRRAYLKKKNITKKPVVRINLRNKKSEPRLAVADYMGHVLFSYLNKKEGNETMYVRNYELLEKKIGLIHNYITKDFYQPRKKPLII